MSEHPTTIALRDPPPASVVVVGAGHAGVQLAASLRQEGYAGSVVLVSSDPHLPYQRPPLSKAFMKGGAEPLPLRAADFYKTGKIDLRLGETVARIDRDRRRVDLGSGTSLDYGHLVLATGAVARPFAVPGHDLGGVLALRTVADAAQVRERLGAAGDVLVVGAGFIGLELAAVAAAAGKRVRVVELGSRPLGRAVSSHISTFTRDSHAVAGATMLFGAGVAALEGEGGTVTAATLTDGQRVAADLVLVGIGVLPDDALARQAGLSCDNGVLVDAFLATADPHVSAIGDCALFPSHHAATPLRLESVQNAVDQARCLARRLAGRPPEPYRDLPWFWSDQGTVKLQIAGLGHGCDRWVMRGDPAAGAFTVFGFRGAALAVIETVNRPADHMVARKLLAAGTALTPEQAADPGFDLRAALAPRG